VDATGTGTTVPCGGCGGAAAAAAAAETAAQVCVGLSRPLRRIVSRPPTPPPKRHDAGQRHGIGV